MKMLLILEEFSSDGMTAKTKAQNTLQNKLFTIFGVRGFSLEVKEIGSEGTVSLDSLNAPNGPIRVMGFREC